MGKWIHKLEAKKKSISQGKGLGERGGCENHGNRSFHLSWQKTEQTPYNKKLK